MGDTRKPIIKIQKKNTLLNMLSLLIEDTKN